MKKRAGLTLIELLVVMGVTVILIGSIALAYDAGIQFQQRVPEQDAVMRRQIQFEDRLRRIFEGAYLTTDETDLGAYFVTHSAGGDLSNPDTLVFTTLGLQPNSAFMRSEEMTFEESNERFGPQGGLAEVAFSMIPVGTAPVEDALFLRVQRPPDGDQTQGGFESALLENLQSFTFEFYDGLDWVTGWNTDTGQRRLPAAVRLRYTFLDEADEHVLTIRIPHSDITPENPLQEVIGGE